MTTMTKIFIASMTAAFFLTAYASYAGWGLAAPKRDAKGNVKQGSVSGSRSRTHAMFMGK